MDNLGGIKCEMGSDGKLVIADKRVPYDGLEVLVFKAKLPGQWLWNISPLQPVPYPAAPILNANTKAIEYPNYSNQTIKKIINDS